MSDNIPSSTAAETILPNGDTVWVQTASDLQLEEIRDEASWYARSRVNDFRKGNSRYKLLLADIKVAGSEAHASLIAQEGYATGEFRKKVWEKYPRVVKPIREEEDSDETFMQKQDEYEKKVKEYEEARETYAKELYDNKHDEALKLSSQKRLQEAVERVISQRYADAWNLAYTNNLLYIVVRTNEDHNEKYFETPDSLNDKQWEECRAHLIKFYNTVVDTVDPNEIPTLPVE